MTVIGCVASRRANYAVIPVGEALEVNGFWHKCEYINKTQNVRYTQGVLRARYRSLQQDLCRTVVFHARQGDENQRHNAPGHFRDAMYWQSGCNG